MTEKKFHIPSIIIASAAVILELFSFILEGAIVAIIALVICGLKRKTHRIKIGVALAIFALIFGIGAFFAFMLIASQIGPDLFETGYWFIDLIF
ncbi:MAG: hypothetical protein J6K17_05730 [Oscillospiraceae bacterium]|nr:hypothetical protein [Oscillospiraceae bacterium]